MKPFFSSAVASYREFRAAKKKSKAYRITRNVILLASAAFVFLLSFPQFLFAHEVSYNNFKLYSQQPIDPSVTAVLDKVQARLESSPLNNDEVKPRVFLINNFRVYSMLSLYIGANSFGKGYAMLPTDNVFMNKSDVSKDLVFRNAPANNSRRLSGVIAHETTHLLIRKRFGYWRNLTMPTWKKEGYAEYVAGGSTLPYETGVKMWKENPKDGTGYQYFKYYMLVKYLLEQEKISVDDLFNRDFDVASLEAKVLSSL
jgi:hypothetical protein